MDGWTDTDPLGPVINIKIHCLGAQGEVRTLHPRSQAAEGGDSVLFYTVPPRFFFCNEPHKAEGSVCDSAGRTVRGRFGRR